MVCDSGGKARSACGPLCKPQFSPANSRIGDHALIYLQETKSWPRTARPSWRSRRRLDPRAGANNTTLAPTPTQHGPTKESKIAKSVSKFHRQLVL